MVSVEKENVYHLRQYLHDRAVDGSRGDAFKSAFLAYLGLDSSAKPVSDESTSLYQRCAIAGIFPQSVVSAHDVSRLLGQASRIDSTPRPWVADIFGVLCVKWLVESMNQADLTSQYRSWVSGFMPQQLAANKLNPYERDLAAYISEGEQVTHLTSCIPLFLHYTGRRRIDDHKGRRSLAQSFMAEFQQQARMESSIALQSAMVYVFDKLSAETALVPPSGWSLDDLIGFLENIPAGLKRWTWEDAPRTRGADSIKWVIENEYHVQNLLYVLLAPIFVDIADEVYLKPVGQKTPRVDLYLPSVHTIIEVKFRSDSGKSFQKLISEVAEDASLYRADPTYRDANLIAFLWDRTRATQEHHKFKEGVMKLPDMGGCVVVSAPSVMG